MTNQLVPIEVNNQRILTTQQLAEVYETDTNNIKNNFANHKSHFVEGVHYFLLKGEELKAFKREVNNIDFANTNAENQVNDIDLVKTEDMNQVNNIDLVDKRASHLYLWTERGANRHCKILDTDKAWEQFDNLEETYFRVKEQRPACIEDVLIQSLQEMKEVKQQIQATNKRLDGISDIVALDTHSWREDARRLIVKIAQAIGGNEYIKDVNAEVFRLVELRGAPRLSIRLTNMRRRMADNGVCKSKRDRLNKVDVIAEDKKLIEIYVAIVKEMAIKYGVDTVA